MFTRMQSILMFRVGHSRNSGKFFLFSPKSWALESVIPASYPGQFALSDLTRGGLEPSAIGEFSREAWQVTSNPKSPRTTGNEAAVIRIPLTIGIRTPSSTGKESEIQYLESRIQDRLGLPYMGGGKCFGIYYIDFEITGYPCNLIGSQRCDLFLNRTIFCAKSHLFQIASFMF